MDRWGLIENEPVTKATQLDDQTKRNIGKYLCTYIPIQKVQTLAGDLEGSKACLFFSFFVFFSFVSEISKKYLFIIISKMSNNSSIIPGSYRTPAFPSLYSLIPGALDEPKYLYYTKDIWRFTLFWTIIYFEGFHLAASGYAVIVQRRNWKAMWIVPVLYMIVAGVEAVLAGSVVGLM